jgi:hypothetical protein
MFTQIDVRSPRLNVPNLALGRFYPSETRTYIRDISGIGPVKAEITTTPFSQDGVLFQSARLGMRNIVLTLGLNSNWVDNTMSSLRRLLYDYFLPKSWCTLRFYSDDMSTVEIQGYVEDFEPNMFSRDPEIQISIICPQPDFVGIDKIEYTGVDKPSTTVTFDYLGTVETGFDIEIGVITSPGVQTERIRIRQPGTYPYPLYDTFETSLVDASNNYQYHLSTMKTSKKSEYIREDNGLVINQMANKIDGSVWPLIKPGENDLQVYRYGSTEETPKAWTLWFYNRYGGI